MVFELGGLREDESTSRISGSRCLSSLPDARHGTELVSQLLNLIFQRSGETLVASPIYALPHLEARAKKGPTGLWS